MREQLRKQNVTCYYTGTKIVNGVDTGEPCIVVGVKQKVPLSQLSPDHIVPKTCDGLRTDVVEMAEFKAAVSATDELRPMIGGISVSTTDDITRAGTLGIIVRDSVDQTLLALTNNHVIGSFYDGNYTPVTDGHLYPDNLYDVEVCQPGIIDGGDGTAYGYVKRAVPYQGGVGTNTVDAAVFQLDTNDAFTEILDIHKGPFPFATRAELTIGTEVMKSGRTSGVTPPPVGVVTAKDLAAYVTLPSGSTLWFEDQILINGIDFSESGDSGSAVLAVIGGQYKVVGLLFANSATSTLANHIDNVATALNIESWDGSLSVPLGTVISTRNILLSNGTIYYTAGYTNDPGTTDEEDNPGYLVDKTAEIDGIMPYLTMVGEGGGEVKISIFELVSTILMTSTEPLNFSGVIGKLTMTAYAIASESGNAYLTLPLFQTTSTGYSSYPATIGVSLLPLRAESSILNGDLMSMAGQCPVLKITATAHWDKGATASLVIPSLRLVSRAENSEILAILMNTKNFALTEYSNYNYNGLGVFNGKIVGTSKTGIYELSGDDDDGENISWSFKTGKLDLDDGVQKRGRHVWVSNKTAGDLMLVADDGETEYEYAVDSYKQIDDAVRVKLGKGIRNRYIQLELKNIANEKMRLDKMRFFAEKTQKGR